MLRYVARQGWSTSYHAASRQGLQLASAHGLRSLRTMCLDSPLVLHQSDGEGIQYCTRLLLRPEPCVSWTKSFASEATDAQGQSVPAKPIKKGLSAGTVPPATEQVPHGVLEQQQAQAQGTGKTLRNTGSTNGLQQHSAAVGKDRPSASSVPAGADQVPPSSVGHIPSQVVQTGSSNDDEPSTSDSQHPESMDSLITDIEDAGQLGKAPSKPSAVHSAQPVVSRWQRFQWWIWGTPQQYWTDQISTDNASSTAQSSKDGPDAASTSNTDSPEGSKMWQRSRYSLGDIIGSAILRSGITKDEDVARFVSKSAAIAAYTLAGFSLLGTLGVDTKPLVAGLGVGGFTAGFALRDVATNFVSGVLLVLQRPFEKGDKLRVHAGSTVLEGEVQSIELRYIVLKPKDQSTIMIPASIVYASPVVVLK